MKYIVIKYHEDGLEYPIIFPGTENHSDIAEKFDSIIVSAGFIAYDDCIADDFKLYCYGESFTLGISSRGKIDTELIKRRMKI